MFNNKDFVMRALISTLLILISLLSWPLTAGAAAPLPYGVRDDVRRQTQNMGEIEREIETIRASVAAGPSPQQQAMLAQFQQMLAANPQLKAQFDAATPEQQAQFMAQLGITSAAPGSDMMTQYGWLEQRLDSVEAVINRAPADHPDVVALKQRHDAARSAIRSTESADAENTSSALAANDLSDFPNFEQDLATAESMTMAIANAVNAAKSAIESENGAPNADEMWLLSNSFNFSQLKSLKQAVENVDGFETQIGQWQRQYAPLFNRSSVYAGQWQTNIQYFPQLAANLRAMAPQVLALLASNIQHNLGVLDQLIATAVERRAASYFDGGIRQVEGEINAVVEAYPDHRLAGAPQQSAVAALQQQAADRIAAGQAGLADLVVAERRMPGDHYSGDDADELKDKAVTFIERRLPDIDILEVTICCEWDVENYEEVVEDYPGHWVKRVHNYRDIQITILSPKDDERALIRIVGIRQNFVTNQESIELLNELEMLSDNI